MKVCLITATKNRHKQLERLVRFVLEQTYENYVHLIYNNAPQQQRLNTNLPANKFILINNHTHLKERRAYRTLGEIYNDAIRFIPEDVDIVNFMDDDDIFLPNHVEEGVKGYIKGGKKAYKPQRSYYKQTGNRLTLVENTLEPSIFVDAKHIKEHGFGDESVAQHHKWLNPLVYDKQIFVDPEGVPTYICDWSQEIPTFKTSGNPHNPENFNNYASYSQDIGDGIITPVSKSWAEHYYRLKPTP